MGYRRVAFIVAAGACAVFAACNGLGDSASDGEPDAGEPGENVGNDAGADARVDELNTVDGGDADADPDVAVPSTATPTFLPVPGNFDVPQCITMMSATPGAAIYYTTDGTAPTTNSLVYDGGVRDYGGVIELRALAIAPGFAPSAVSGATYVVNTFAGVNEPPLISPEAGTYSGPLEVTLAPSNSGPVFSICFSTDGGTPHCSGDQPSCGVVSDYNHCGPTSISYEAGAPLVLTAPPDGGVVTVTAIACGDGIPGLPSSATYTLHQP